MLFNCQRDMLSVAMSVASGGSLQDLRQSDSAATHLADLYNALRARTNDCESSNSHGPEKYVDRDQCRNMLLHTSTVHCMGE